MSNNNQSSGGGMGNVLNLLIIGLVLIAAMLLRPEISEVLSGNNMSTELKFAPFASEANATGGTAYFNNNPVFNFDMSGVREVLQDIAETNQDRLELELWQNECAGKQRDTNDFAQVFGHDPCGDSPFAPQE